MSKRPTLSDSSPKNTSKSASVAIIEHLHEYNDAFSELTDKFEKSLQSLARNINGEMASTDNSTKAARSDSMAGEIVTYKDALSRFEALINLCERII